MKNLKRKVSFYKLALVKSNYNEERNVMQYRDLPNDQLFFYFNKIYINAVAIKNGNKAIDVNTSNSNYIIEIVDFNENNIFFKIGQQNPADTVALRDSITFETEKVPMTETQSLEVFTYCLLDFSTGILSYISNVGAPKISAIKSLINNSFYESERVEALISVIATNDILDTLIHKKIISSIDLTVAVPEDEVLSDKLGLSEYTFDSLENVKTSNLSFKIVANRNKSIFAKSNQFGDLIASLREKYGKNLLKLTVSAKNSDENSQLYDIMSYNFTKVISIDTQDKYLTENNFKACIISAYNDCKDELLRYCKA